MKCIGLITLLTCLITTACARNMPASQTNQRLEGVAIPAELDAATATRMETVARDACQKAFAAQASTPRLMHVASNPETQRWQIQLINGGWSGLKPGIAMTITNSPGPDLVESCIVVIDASNDRVVSMRDF